METKILSFEEFSTKGTDTAVASTVDTAPTVDTATTTDTTDTTTTDTEVTTDTETEETTDQEETTTDTEETEDVEESEEVEEPKTVAEMMNELKEAMKAEAKAYESDDYDEHTVEQYLKENASLSASIATNALEEMKEGDNSYTKESYEATCNSIKEAYAKKIDEALEAYGTDEEVRTETDNEQDDAVLVSPTK